MNDNSKLKNNLMYGKRGIVMGVANERSLAWGIAKSLASSGTEIAFTYQSESLEKRVRPLANSINSDLLFYCDVKDQSSIEQTFSELQKNFQYIDFVVHAIAYSDKEELTGRYINTSKDNFLNTMDISCYSFTSVAQKAVSLMKEGGSLLTLSYLGAQKVIPHYNVMGVAKAALEASVKYLAADLGNEGLRVNGISAGPIKTLAASGISDFRYILKWNEYNAPLGRNTSLKDVGGAAVYLLSELGAGTTGEIIYVDSGYHIVGMKNPNAPDISKV